MNNKIILLDEMGKEQEFIILATFGLDDVDYAALIPSDDMESLTYILRMEIDENGDSILMGIDDEEELKEAIEAYEEIQKEKLQ
ncbi:DUF1292 domain-containing protein [Tissierella sp. MSJ-40]|uniref:DUF1292 domain-containing protein n=1 Tax=Tissierella simiarum TaxID=2841534 RepID=A0ABS6EDA2_9FIRM|nr:DUF1292 domain-containing protein [Tissierella simiarum]MBU5440214.1 DUF1292 domain-containing protein [Tissierella simiarum]